MTHHHYVAGQFGSQFNTPLGRNLWDFLNEPNHVIRMETATYLGRPALEPLSPYIEARFGAPAFADRVKQMQGHMARQIMERHGHRFDRSGVPITRPGNRFSSAARYVWMQQSMAP